MSKNVDLRKVRRDQEDQSLNNEIYHQRVHFCDSMNITYITKNVFNVVSS
jgi:hypothetical protein